MQTPALRKGGLQRDLSSTSTSSPKCALPSKRPCGHRGRKRKKQFLSNFHPFPSQLPPLCLATLGEGSLGANLQEKVPKWTLKSARRKRWQAGPTQLQVEGRGKVRPHWNGIKSWVGDEGRTFQKFGFVKGTESERDEEGETLCWCCCCVNARASSLGEGGAAQHQHIWFETTLRAWKGGRNWGYRSKEFAQSLNSFH